VKSFIHLFLSVCLFSAAASAQEPGKLKVAEFNTWGVPVVVWDTGRYAQAMKALEELNPDVILLEEVFSGKGKRAFHSEAYPYEAHGPKGFPRILNSGLKILSKYPIERRATLVYGSCSSLDCLSRKGALLVVIALPNGKKLNVVVTHLNTTKNSETEGQLKQLAQLSLFISTYAEKNSPILVGGDFNFEAESSPYPYLLQHLHEWAGHSVTDLWTQTHAADEPGFTSDGYDNHYASDYSRRTRSPIDRKRIDYLFSDLTPVSSQVIFKETPYSDHYGLLGEYQY
jgi:endonuclease/exonuclease/phosphatase family metal-dependent hydrolase